MRRPGISPVERALIAKAWHDAAVTAHIHALIGGDARNLVQESGRVFWVVLGACAAEEVDPDMPEVRILRGACNALYEQADVALIDEGRRASLVSGLQACERLVGALQRKSLTDAAVELAVKLRTGHVDWHEYERHIERLAA